MICTQLLNGWRCTKALKALKTQKRANAYAYGCSNKRMQPSFAKRVAKQACPLLKPAKRLGWLRSEVESAVIALSLNV